MQKIVCFKEIIPKNSEIFKKNQKSFGIVKKPSEIVWNHQKSVKFGENHRCCLFNLTDDFLSNFLWKVIIMGVFLHVPPDDDAEFESITVDEIFVNPCKKAAPPQMVAELLKK